MMPCTCFFDGTRPALRTSRVMTAQRVRNCPLQIYFTTAELKEIRTAAKRRTLSVSAWARMVLIGEAGMSAARYPSARPRPKRKRK